MRSMGKLYEKKVINREFCWSDCCDLLTTALWSLSMYYVFYGDLVNGCGQL